MSDLVINCTKSPLGEIRVIVEANRIKSLSLCAKDEASLPEKERSSTPEHEKTNKQLELYFAGQLQNFDLPLDFSGYSEFAVLVLKALQKVAFGTTVSYGELAVLAGRPGAARAVGRVVGSNRTPILIPCHRVVGSTGKLVGFSATGGLDTKRWLLEFEQKIKGVN